MSLLSKCTAAAVVTATRRNASSSTSTSCSTFKTLTRQLSQMDLNCKTRNAAFYQQHRNLQVLSSSSFNVSADNNNNNKSNNNNIRYTKSISTTTTTTGNSIMSKGIPSSPYCSLSLFNNNNNNNDIKPNNNNQMKIISRTITKKKKRKKYLAKKQWESKNASKLAAESAQEGGGTGEVNVQHKEYVKFQQSIAVDGFETGQTLKAMAVKKSDTGQHVLKKMKSSEAAALRKRQERPELLNVRGGRLPSLRYSDEETDRLLKEAYDAIPVRAGKRGNRNLRRQKRRWFLVRKIHKKEKYYKKLEQVNKMLKRKDKVEQVLHMINVEAPGIRERDNLYQQQVLQTYMSRVLGLSSSGSNSSVMEGNDNDIVDAEYVDDNVDGDGNNKKGAEASK